MIQRGACSKCGSRDHFTSDHDACSEALNREVAAVPRLTEAKIREALRVGAKSANALLKELNRSHLAGMSRSMSLRLD